MQNNTIDAYRWNGAFGTASSNGHGERSANPLRGSLD